MTGATERLIALAERLHPTGVIGDGMVAEFHDLAAKARVEQAEDLAAHPAAHDLAVAIASRYAVPLETARQAMQEFVDKVDRGEARSRRSYAAFKLALGRIREAFPHGAQRP